MSRIIEQYLLSKNKDGRGNEDGIFLSDDFIAVIDGATAKSDQKINGKSGGEIIRDQIMKSLQKMDKDIDVYEAYRFIHEKILEGCPEEAILHMTASAIIFSNSRKQIWLIGDCQALINGHLLSNHSKVDDVLSEARSLAIGCLINEGISIEELFHHDQGRELIMPLLKKQLYLENGEGEFAYPVFNNSPKTVDPEKIGILIAEVKEGDEIVLASDGYPYLKNTLAESEEALAQLLQQDPLCYKVFKSTKGLTDTTLSFDDRAYIRFLV